MDDDTFNIKVFGDNLPARIERFTEAGFSAEMMDNIAANGYTLPSPIQKHLIPIVRESYNLVAYSDCGKYEAPGFLMPVINKLMSKPESEKKIPIKPLVIIIDSMRDSVVETHRVAMKLIQGSKLQARVACADYNVTEQDEKIRDGCDILVVTPERLLQLVEQKIIGFEKIEILVLDQTDTIFGEGFREDIEQFIKEMSERQILVFSSKLTDKQFAEKDMPNYVSASVGIRR